jgi:FixJ family two-component response regulator
LKILIADNDLKMSLLLQAILQANGFTAVTLAEGADILKSIRDDEPELVLLDPEAAGPDQERVFSEIKKINDKLPVIVFSDPGNPEPGIEAVKNGASNFIPKPFKVDDLLKMIRNILKLPATTAGAPSAPRASASMADRGPITAKKNLLPYIYAVTAAVVAGLIVIFLRTHGIVTEYGIPYSNPSGICSDGKKVWVSDWLSGTIYRHSEGKGFPIEASYSLKNIQPAGLAYDGKHLWLADAMDMKIYELKGDTDLTAAAEHRVTDVNPYALLAYNSFIWVVDFQKNKIFKYLAGKDLTLVYQADSPSSNPCGLFVMKGLLYVADAGTGKIYSMDPKELTVRGIYELPIIKGREGKHPSCITFDGKYLWACYSGVPRVFKIKSNGLSPVSL